MNGVYSLHTADDGTIPIKKGETVSSVMKQRREMELHSYCDLIKEHTFKTRFISVDEATAAAWRVKNRGDWYLDRKQNALLERLGAEIDAVIKQFDRDGHRVFFRLSTRSPKDAISLAPRCRATFVRLLSERLPAEGSNRLVEVVQDCVGSSMTVATSSDVFEIVAHSSRCVSDIVRLCKYREHLPNWDLRVVLRTHVPMRSCDEFRCFVHEGRLTAISQYFASIYYPQLAENKSHLKQTIGAYVRKRIDCLKKSRLSTSSYVMDVAVLPGGMRIVELNPFSHTTGACLFDWIRDADVLRRGPLEIRVVSKPFSTSHSEAVLRSYAGVVEEARRRSLDTRRTLWWLVAVGLFFVALGLFCFLRGT